MCYKVIVTAAIRNNLQEMCQTCVKCSWKTQQEMQTRGESSVGMQNTVSGFRSQLGHLRSVRVRANYFTSPLLRFHKEMEVIKTQCIDLL